MSESGSKLAAAEVTSAVAATVALAATGGSRFVRWLAQRTKTTDELAQYQREVMAHFTRFERWCARVDDFMARYGEHRIADERFMARADAGLRSFAQRIGRLERTQDHAA